MYIYIYIDMNISYIIYMYVYKYFYIYTHLYIYICIWIYEYVGRYLSLFVNIRTVPIYGTAYVLHLHLKIAPNPLKLRSAP